MKVFLSFLVGAVIGLVVGLHGTNCPFLVKLCPYVQGRLACVCPMDCCRETTCDNSPCINGWCKPKKVECGKDCKHKSEVLSQPNMEEAPKKMPHAKD